MRREARRCGSRLGEEIAGVRLRFQPHGGESSFVLTQHHVHSRGAASHRGPRQPPDPPPSGWRATTSPTHRPEIHRPQLIDPKLGSRTFRSSECPESACPSTTIANGTISFIVPAVSNGGGCPAWTSGFHPGRLKSFAGTSRVDSRTTPKPPPQPRCRAVALDPSDALLPEDSCAALGPSVLPSPSLS